MTVRSYCDTDRRELMHLFHDTIHAVNCRDYSPVQINAWGIPVEEMSEERWAKLGKSQTFVAEENGQLLGFGELDPDGYIDRFYTHKDWQGRGVGTTVLETIENTARAQNTARLYAEVSITARSFFERRGFQVIAEQTVVARGVEFANFQMEKLLR